MEGLCPLSRLTDDELEARLRGLVLKSNELCAELIAHLTELDRRKLYARWACPSLHAYCTSRLGFSDSAAYKRIAAARQAAKFPVILERIRSGKNHLSAIVALSGYLTDENHEELLSAAEGLSQRALEKLIRMRHPLPDVPDAIRKLPNRGPRQENLTVLGPAIAVAHGVPHGKPGIEPESAAGESDASALGVRVEQRGSSNAPSSESSAALDEASPSVRYKIQFTADQSFLDKIEQARALLSHQLPRGELTALFEKALDRLIAELLQKRFGIRRGRQRLQQKSGGESNGRQKLDSALEGHSTNSNDSNGQPRQALEADALDETLPDESRNSREAAKREQCRHRAAPDEKLEKQPERTDSSPEESHANTEPASWGAKKRKIEPAIGRSRYVPQAVRRAVAERDELRCSFVGDDGERCPARRFLELQHYIAHARGGQQSVENLSLFCRAHNQHDALLQFGARHVAAAIAKRTKRSASRQRRQ